MIRRANEADIPKILDLLLSVNNVHATLRPDIFRPDTRKYTGNDLRTILAEDKTPVFVLTDDADRPLGYAFCILKETNGDPHMADRKVLYIDDICVDEAARGHGIGTQLCEFVTQEARRMGCQSVTLNVWTGNDAAHALYASQGFVPLKTTMEKRL